ncbi:UNVERIFIED_CONTAM: hypothetical protein FKN15_071910 [Acipenser sinensis]
MGGMVLETNMNEIVAQVENQNRLEKSEGGLSAAPARAVSAVKNMNLPEIPRNINIGDINIKGGLSAAPARAVSAVKNMNLPEIPRNINIGDINIKVPNLSPFV